MNSLLLLDFFKPAVRKTNRKILLTSLLLCLSGFTTVHAQTISGGTLVIGSGAILTATNDMSIQSGAALDVQSGGTLVLKMNLSNLNATANSIGNGLIEVSGSTAQAISGQNIIANLTMNNTAGLTVSGNTRVTGTLALTGGIITLGSNNLTLGTAATISGTPSVTNMIAAEGTGQLRKEFSAAGSFVFPVGDNTAPAGYSPVTLNFASGTFVGGAYAGVNLVNAKYPDANITTSYLNRYWTVTQSGITGFSCTASFNYVDADITGTEGNLFCLKTEPSPFITYDAVNAGSNLLTAPGLASFSTFTGAMGTHEFNLTAFLEGPYNSGSMNTTLRTGGLLPLTQPYNTAPWSYAGTETVASIPAGVVDWILIELRQADAPANATSGTIISKRAAFIKSDGTIVDVDGTSALRFYNTNITQNLYPVVRHRNHLAIMAATGVTKTSGIYTYNFSDAGSKTYGYPSGIKQVGLSWCTVGGNGSPDADINTDDISFSWNLQFGNYGYYSGDFSLNGSVDTDDISFFWNPNFGYSGGITDNKKQGYHSMVP
jgi:hypothetical protein